MKNTLRFFTFLLLTISSLAYANNNGYFSKQHTAAHAPKTNVKLSMVAPTDIIINNASYYTVNVTVPAGGFTDNIPPRGFDHIMNQNGAFFTRLILQDGNFRVFYDGVFCPHASITVYGNTPGDVVVDTKSC